MKYPILKTGPSPRITTKLQKIVKSPNSQDSWIWKSGINTVLSNAKEISQEGYVTYLPIYYVMFIKENPPKEVILKL